MTQATHENVRVGYLRPRGRGYGAVCSDHRSPSGRNVPLYRVNIWPYTQRCDVCGTVLVEGARGWPQLFDGR